MIINSPTMSESVSDFLTKIGTKLNRTPHQMKPILEKLTENWYETVDDLKNITDDGWKDLSLPARLVDEIKKELNGGGGGGAAAPVAASAPAPTSTSTPSGPSNVLKLDQSAVIPSVGAFPAAPNTATQGQQQASGGASGQRLGGNSTVGAGQRLGGQDPTFNPSASSTPQPPNPNQAGGAFYDLAPPMHLAGSFPDQTQALQLLIAKIAGSGGKEGFTKQDLETCLLTLFKLIHAILKSPSDEAKRSINLQNKNFSDRVGRHPQALEFLKGCGFKHEGGTGTEADTGIFICREAYRSLLFEGDTALRNICKNNGLLSGNVPALPQGVINPMASNVSNLTAMGRGEHAQTLAENRKFFSMASNVSNLTAMGRGEHAQTLAEKRKLSN